MKIIKNFIIRRTLKNYIRYWEKVRERIEKRNPYICNIILTLNIPNKSKKIMFRHLVDFAIQHGKEFDIRDYLIQYLNNNYKSILKTGIREAFWKHEEIQNRLKAVNKIIEMIEKDIKKYS